MALEKSTGFVGKVSRGAWLLRALFLDGKQLAVDVAMAIAAGAANVCEVTLSVVNADGILIAGSHVVDVYLSDSATGEGLTAVTASGAVTVKAGAGTDLGATTAKKAFRAVTDPDGTLVISITDTAKTGFYVCASVPTINRVDVSRVLVAGDYGA